MNCDLDNLFDESKAMFELIWFITYKFYQQKGWYSWVWTFWEYFFQIFAHWFETPAIFLIRNWKCPQNICILECLFNFHFLWKMHQNCSNVTWNRSQGMKGVKSEKKHCLEKKCKLQMRNEWSRKCKLVLWPNRLFKTFFNFPQNWIHFPPPH